MLGITSVGFYLFLSRFSKLLWNPSLTCFFFFHSLEYCSLKRCVGVLGLIKRPSIRAQMCTELCSPRPLCYVLLWVIEFSSKVTAQDIVTLISNHFVATVFFLLQCTSMLKLIAFAIFLNTFLQYWDKLKVFDYITDFIDDLDFVVAFFVVFLCLCICRGALEKLGMVSWLAWSWGLSHTPPAHLVLSALHLASWQIILSTTHGTCSPISIHIFL